MVRGLPQLKASSKICTDCRWESNIGMHFQREVYGEQLVHADICGPIKPLSNSKKRYFISFIDDYSGKVWIYFLAEKSEAFTIFKNFKNLVEKETGDFIHCLRTERSREFTSHEFNNFCKINGISRHLLQPTLPNKMVWLSARTEQL